MSDAFTLAAVQRAFGAALDGAAIAPLFAGDAAHVVRRFDVYRNNVRLVRMAALRNAYPVVAQLVGDEFFDALTRRFATAHGSTSGDLNRYGAEFADFLASFEHTREALPYLADVARLEHAVHRAHYAADAPSLDPASLADVAPEAQGALRFAAQPALALIESPWPVAPLWLAHQPGTELSLEEIPMRPHARAGTAVVWREGFDVRVAALDATEHAIVAALCRGATLTDAFDAAWAVAPHVDLGAILARAFREGWFTTVHLPGDPNSLQGAAA
jgi:hypothetical protein